jgi:hypothetical protein
MDCSIAARWRVLQCCFTVVAVLPVAGPAAAAEKGAMAVEPLLASAAAAEIAGNSVARAAYLQDAVQADPTSRVARWQLGQLKVNGEWQQAEEVQQATAADPKQRTYAALRTSFGDTPEGQLALARWCEKYGLKEEARFHWVSVLAVEPNFAEALRALDAQWFNGQLLTREQLDAAKAHERELERAMRTWTGRAATWQRNLAGELTERMAVLAEIRALHSPEAIPAVERFTLDAGESSDLQIVRQRQMSLAFFDALDAMSSPDAVASLVRHAVLSPQESVRAAAIERLMERPLYDYVPFLLDGLATPVRTWFGVVTAADGTVQYEHTFYREGPFADWSATSRQVGFRPPPRMERADAITDWPDATPLRPGIERQREVRNTWNTANRFATRFSREAMIAEQHVTQENASVARTNELIVPVLAQATGQDFGTDARDWWTWWQDYTEYDRSQGRPVYTQTSYQAYTPPPLPPPHSCFVKGTLVWTKTGKRPIETLRMGDFVLSRNVESGELAYKPVLGTTVRPPRPIVKLSAGDEQIFATLGHPIWVAGAGWRMAKELSSGDVLHGVNEPVRLSAATPAEDDVAYNLIVADFSTYFVGNAGILVHDNSPMRPTAVALPGVAMP